MSYDLNFWRQKPGLSTPPQAIYEQLCDGHEVDGLEEIPVERFLDRIRETFSGTENYPGTLDWEGEQGAFQVSWTTQYVRVDCYGLSGEDMNKFIDIALEFSCPLYDPQTGVRFDSADE